MIWLTPSLADIINPYANGLVVWFDVDWTYQWTDCSRVDLDKDDVYQMTMQLRHIVDNNSQVQLSGKWNVTACTSLPDTRNNPKSWKKKRRKGRAPPKGGSSRGTLKRKAPHLWDDNGSGGHPMLENVQQVMIKPIIKPREWGVWSHDEYTIYDALPQWGYEHKSVCDAQENMPVTSDNDGFVRCMSTRWAGFWSCCSWLRPHRGISQREITALPGLFWVCPQCS